MPPSGQPNVGQGKNRNPLEEDLQDLERTSADTSLDPATRERDKKRAERIRRLLFVELPSLREEAEKLGLREYCRKLRDDDIAFYVGDAVRSDVPALYTAICAELDLMFRSHGWPLDETSQRAAKHLFDLLSIALCDELEERQVANENAQGRDVRLYLVEEGERGKRLRDLGKQAAGGLELYERGVEGREEATSEATLKVWQQVHPFAEPTPVAGNPEVLSDFMKGGFNRVLERARDFVRTQIETETRRRSVTVSAVVNLSAGEEPREVPLVDLLSSSVYSPVKEEEKILLEQLVQLANLTDKERGVVSTCRIEGKTQAEVARKFSISQGQVSKLLKTAQAKLRQAAGFSDR